MSSQHFFRMAGYPAKETVSTKKAEDSAKAEYSTGECDKSTSILGDWFGGRNIDNRRLDWDSGDQLLVSAGHYFLPDVAGDPRHGGRSGNRPRDRNFGR